MNDTDLALFLTRASGYYYEQDRYRIDYQGLREAIGVLAQPDLLSVRAIAAIVGCSEYRVRLLWPLDTPMTKHRGTLNPNYLSYMAYLLSGVRVAPVMISEMLSECSPSIVSRLTNISDDTLQRWKRA